MQTDTQTHSLRIGVFVQDNAGKPIGHLSARDFTLSSQGVRLPFKLVRPVLGSKPPAGAYEPTRMLILLSPHIADSTQTLNAVLPALDPLWQRDWQIAAVLSNGSRTDYATSAAQLRRFWTNAQPSGPARPETAASAINDLDTFTGRRIVLYLAASTDKQEMPPKPILDAARKVMAQTLDVNGGYPDSSPGGAVYYEGGIPSLFGGPAAERASNSSTPSAYRPNSSESHTKVSRQDDWYLYVAVNTHTAIHQALRDAEGYYSLRIPRASLATLPPGTLLSVKIHITDAPNFTATTIAYGKNPPQILLAKR